MTNRRFGYKRPAHDKPAQRRMKMLRRSSFYEEKLLPVYPTLDQGETSSCIAHALARSIQIVERGVGALPSRRWIYYMLRALRGWEGVDGGGYLYDAFSQCELLGWPDESVFPWREDMHSLCESPPFSVRAKAVDDYDRLEVFEVEPNKSQCLDALDRGFPLCVGAAVTTDFCDCHDINSPVLMTGMVEGEHAFVLVGWNRKGFVYQNSWGPDYGSQGYGTLDYDAIGALEEIYAITIHSN